MSRISCLPVLIFSTILGAAWADTLPAGQLSTANSRGDRRSFDVEGAKATSAPSETQLASGALCAQPSQNCQPPIPIDALASNAAGFIVADDFTPASSGGITSLCFWGTYGFTDCEQSPQNFTVHYYDNMDGRPGALLAAFSQEGGELTVNGPHPTGSMISSWPEYEFSAMHPPLPVTAGNCYWVEITNQIAGCSWYWETGANRNRRAFQDGRAGTEPDGYDVEETIPHDLAFCIDQPLGDPRLCYPPVPPNDACANAIPIDASGDFLFDVSSATQDGQAHGSCGPFSTAQISHDVWYCWTAPCTDIAAARTCEITATDTRIAAYNGCGCPPAEADFRGCTDDTCGDEGLQSMLTFNVVQGQTYLIRLGTFPGAAGGAGILQLTCGLPDNPACPGSGSCCDPHLGPGCENETCCETVCACDPYCCDVEWDAFCAFNGLSGCGAAALCPAECGSGCTDDSECDDGGFCNGEETCGAGGCQPGQPVVCDDGIDCTLDGCDDDSATCVFQPQHSLCDDGIACTIDTCTPSGCAHNESACGACCLAERACADQLSEAECLADAGSFQGTGSACLGDTGGDGIDDACGLTPIPAVSEWGLVALALCLLIGAKLYARRGARC